jgi:hypothetical protein
LEKLFESWQLIFEPHGENPALDYISDSLFIHYSDFLFNIQASLYSWTRVLFDLLGAKLQLGRAPIHSGRTNNKPHFLLGRAECPVVSSLRRTMCPTDKFFKACMYSTEIPPALLYLRLWLSFKIFSHYFL